MAWTKNNVAHADTYLALRVLDQTKRKFKTAGDQKMKALAFFDLTASANLKKKKARGVASQMDNVFRVFFEAKYEEGFARVESISRLTGALSDENKTVRELADVADACYAFRGEPNVT